MHGARISACLQNLRSRKLAEGHKKPRLSILAWLSTRLFPFGKTSHSAIRNAEFGCESISAPDHIVGDRHRCSVRVGRTEDRNWRSSDTGHRKLPAKTIYGRRDRARSARVVGIMPWMRPGFPVDRDLLHPIRYGDMWFEVLWVRPRLFGSGFQRNITCGAARSMSHSCRKELPRSLGKLRKSLEIAAMRCDMEA